MIQVYHRYELWEDFISGMWRTVSKVKEAEFLKQAIDFTGDSELYGVAMLRVVNEWPISCEHNLSNLGQNRKAWIGHAACQLEFNCPEYITRSAWGFLSKEQQDRANQVAENAIKIWEQRNS